MLAIFLLTGILIIAGQSLVIYGILPSRSPTDSLLAVFSVLILMDAGLMLLTNIGSPGIAYISTTAPFGLIYGPLLFWFYSSTQCRPVKVKVLILHFLPAFLGLLCYFFILINADFRNRILSDYLILLYTAMCLSWAAYPCVILVNKNRKGLLGFGLFKYGMVLLWVLTSYVAPLIWVGIKEGLKESALTTDFAVISTMLVAISLAYWFLIRRVRAIEIPEGAAALKEMEEQSEIIDLASNMSSLKPSKDIPDEYKERIMLYMELEKFFDPNFNLEQMAQDLNLSRAMISQYFVQMYPDGFVKTINHRRIERACSILKQVDIKMTMEEIAFLCGFNSRASFYRNFNQEKGCSPTAYREEALSSNQ